MWLVFMSAKSALRLVERDSFFEESLELGSGLGEPHSLHASISMPGEIPADVAAFFIEKYSRKAQLVLDPFCSFGTVALEAALLGRVSLAADSDPLSVFVTAAKLQPADIAEVTLAVSLLNLRRPITVDAYKDYFAPFYDIDTYREVANLRRAQKETEDRVTQFIALLALGLLHGHSAGCFSAYSLPQVALSPDEQQALNNKRGQLPDYRAVAPRLLKRAAYVLRDGIPSILSKFNGQHAVVRADGRNLSQLQSSTVDLIFTSPPLPLRFRRQWQEADRQWMRRWFAACGEKPKGAELKDEEDWQVFVDEFLFESMRVLKSGGRLILALPSKGKDRHKKTIENALSLIVESRVRSQKRKVWEFEGVYSQEAKSSSLTQREGERAKLSSELPGWDYVVIRRR